MPKKDQQGYYGFDASGLERAAAVTHPLSSSYHYVRQPNT